MIDPKEKARGYAQNKRRRLPNLSDNEFDLIRTSYQAGYAAKEEEDGWVSSEHDPENVIYVLAYNEKSKYTFIAQFIADGRKWFNQNGLPIDVTGWKYFPLPPNPKTT